MSDKNFMLPFRMAAPVARQLRNPAPDDNMFVIMERWASSMIESSLDLYRDFRDQSHEFMFRVMYGNPRVLKRLFLTGKALKVFGATVKKTTSCLMKTENTGCQ